MKVRDFNRTDDGYTLSRQKVSQANTINIILDIIQKLSLAKDIETIMFIVRKAARQLANSDGATFVLRDNSQCYYADEDAIEPLWKGKRFPLNTCVSGWVMLNQQQIVIEDIYNDPRVPADAYRSTFVKSLSMTPICSQAPIGAIGTYWSEYYQPTKEQLYLLKVLADSTSVAMENIQLHSKLEQGNQQTFAQMEVTRNLMEANKELAAALEELNHRNAEMQHLRELSSGLQTCIYLEESYKLIANFLTKLFPNTAGIFYIMHPSRNYLESMAIWNEPFFEEKFIKPDECMGLRRGTLYKVTDPKKELTCAHYQTDNDRAYTCIPLFAQSDILGLLYLEWKPFSQDKYKENQEVLANTVAEQIALGLSNIKLRETLRNQSFRDTLTGLYNRRYLEETLERELSRCGRKSSSCATLMIDIDHFKQFNDKFGHEAGDLVIQSFAQVLNKAARKYDIACRYGGEEFILFLPEIEPKTALARAQQLHKAISKIHLRYGGNMLSQITISVGIAIHPEHGKDMHTLIACADRALYQAKKSGRNRTVMYSKRKRTNQHKLDTKAIK
ncbi:sensor histidine kinase [Legionella beliardensis]|uniref:diguanylate cyclase n=1 Tax=Legionella beliardensis TaxID=91822 RepID=A0A378I3P2_9GAMM|nr:diguanylate cyclase [Legionella beliardensis]STX29321.1 sensor histidine kinase [Legionella beliardensis]